MHLVLHVRNVLVHNGDVPLHMVQHLVLLLSDFALNTLDLMLDSLELTLTLVVSVLFLNRRDDEQVLLVELLVKLMDLTNFLLVCLI